MDPDLKLLTELVPPPDAPVCTDSDWQEVEKNLGVELPGDYKDFVSIYGSGSLQSFIHIVNYSDSRLSSAELISVIFSQLESYQEAGKCEEFKAFPAEGGLLPFASTDDGNYLFWKTEGKPPQWAVAAYDFTSGTIVHIPGLGMVNCLLRLVQKDNPFGDRFCNIENFTPHCTFVPWQEA
tara:strand:- start:2041 stop:2580 length:540 start_codon:yes stop_codon:yes gene_type:complete